MCTKCKKFKELIKFQKYNSQIQSWCRECANEQAKKRNDVKRKNPLW